MDICRVTENAVETVQGMGSRYANACDYASVIALTQMYSLAYIYDSDFVKYFARSDINIDFVELKTLQLLMSI